MKIRIFLLSLFFITSANAANMNDVLDKQREIEQQIEDRQRKAEQHDIEFARCEEWYMNCASGCVHTALAQAPTMVTVYIDCSSNCGYLRKMCIDAVFATIWE